LPVWRGGCFHEGPAGKLINASPSLDIDLFGACAPGGDPASPGGMVYYDRFDPISGNGDVTVLFAQAGSAPRVVGRNGGAGVAGGLTGARFNGAGTRMLTLANVDPGPFHGTLVEVDLRGGAVRNLAVQVRVLNYQYLIGDTALYVGRYNALGRVGDLFYWDGNNSHLLYTSASRYDATMYRVNPARTRVAFLTDYRSAAGGVLHVQDIAPGTSPAIVASGVFTSTFTADGRLLFAVLEGSGPTFAVKIQDPDGTIRILATGVNQWLVLGDRIFYLTGWSIVRGHGDLFRLELAPGALSEPLENAASLFWAGTFGGGGRVAYVGNYDPDEEQGDLFVAGTTGPGVLVDGGVTPRGGMTFSPLGTFVVYPKGFERPRSPGNPNPLPGIADQLWVSRADGGGGFVLADQASVIRVAWTADESRVAGIGAFDPNRESGRLLARATADGAVAFEVADASARTFEFDPLGALAAITGWNMALGRGDLVSASTSGVLPIAPGIAGIPFTRDGRVIYAVRSGDRRSGLWLGGSP
jgi:hypothetical protein